MMNRPMALLTGLAVVLAVASARAQENAASRADDPTHVEAASYGIDNQQISIVASSAMRPTLYSQLYEQYHNNLHGEGTFAAPIQGLVPNGARLESICLYGSDAPNGDSDMALRLVRDVVDSSTGHNPARDTLAEVDSADDAGYSVWCVSDFSRPIIYRYDWDNDGDWQNVAYTLELTTNFNAEFQMARLLWRRAVSPDPNSATFLDVPTGSAYHRWVEALASAGITHGCDVDHFCPNDPVTRGQLAYMLSRALGLDWPAYGVGYVP